jgi:hypothetical protein
MDWWWAKIRNLHPACKEQCNNSDLTIKKWTKLKAISKSK